MQRDRCIPSGKVVIASILLAIGLFTVSLFIGLDEVPSPLFQDEADGLYRILHFASTGRDLDSAPLPILLAWRNAFGSFTYPAYFLPLALFSKLLGSSADFAELRAFGGIFCIITTFMIFKISRLLGVSREYSLFASFLYISSPLSQLSYRIAWDPVSFPFFYILSVYAIEAFLVAFTRSKREQFSLSLSYYLLVGLPIGFLWWGYPPGRLISILLLLWLSARIVYFSKSIPLKELIVIIFGWLITASPVIWATIRLDASFQRTSDLLNKPTLLGAYSSLKSLLSQLTYADYLIFWGDPQRRHSTGFGGVLGFAGVILIIAIVAYIFYSSTRGTSSFSSVRLFSDPSGRIVFYIILATIPSAITFDEFHALRSNGSFPFWAILSSLTLMRVMTDLHSSQILQNLSLLSILAAGIIYSQQGFLYMAGFSSFLSDAQEGATYRWQSREYFQRSDHDRVSSMNDAELVKVVSSYKKYPDSSESRVLFEYFSRRLDLVHGVPFFVHS